MQQQFNVNYSEAGQRLARKAQEQLKTVEKSKEIKQQQNTSLLASALAYNKRNTNTTPKPTNSSGSGGGSTTEDWQNVSFTFS